MKTVCISMDDQGQFYVGMKPEGMDGAPPAPPTGAPMSNSMDPDSDSDYKDESTEAPDYMQPVQSMAEAFQAARSMLTQDDGSGQNDFDAGVKRVLGPNPRPSMDNPRQMATMPPRGQKMGM